MNLRALVVTAAVAVLTVVGGGGAANAANATAADPTAFPYGVNVDVTISDTDGGAEWKSSGSQYSNPDGFLKLQVSGLPSDVDDFYTEVGLDSVQNSVSLGYESQFVSTGQGTYEPWRQEVSERG